MGDTSSANRFPDTHWSRILALRDVADPKHIEHLNRLMKWYWRPIYSYVRSIRNIGVADAEDLTQGFFTMMVTRVDFASISPDQGSFRSFLKMALHRFVISTERKKWMQARRQESPLLPFAEAESELLVSNEDTPEEAFDRAWARQIMVESLEKLRAELIEQGKGVHYEIFREYALEPAQGVTYAGVAGKHGLKEDDVRNYLRSVRIRGRELVKEQLRDYLFPGERMEDELRFVFEK